MVRSPTTAGVIAAALCLSVGAVASADRLEIIGFSGNDPANVALVTGDGQVLVRNGTHWNRTCLGGVATQLLAARGAAPNDVLAVGSHAPPYQFDGRTWTAAPIRQRAPAILATGSGDALVVGRRVYVRQGTRWRPLPPSRARRITAAWSGGRSNIAVATSVPDVRIWRGAGWTSVPVKLASPTERIRMLFSTADGTLLASGDEGTLLTVTATGARTLPLEPRLDSFRPLLSHAPKGGPLTVLGYGIVRGKSRLVVSRIHSKKRGKMVMLLDYVPQTNDVLIGLLTDRRGAILLVTRQGLLLRRTAGGTWSSTQVTSKPISRGPARNNPPAQPK